MTRGRRVPLAQQDLSVNQAVANLVQTHIVAVRRKRGGEIISVKHAAWGWMSVKEYYALDEFHKLQPLIAEVIKGGYELKAWLWNTGVSFDLLASGLTVPFGLILATFAAGQYAVDSAKVSVDQAAAQAWTAYNKALSFYNSLPAVYAPQEGGARRNPANGEWVSRPTPPDIAQNPYPNADIYQTLDWLALLLPWGEVYYIWVFYEDISDLIKGVTHLQDRLQAILADAKKGLAYEIYEDIVDGLQTKFPQIDWDQWR